MNNYKWGLDFGTSNITLAGTDGKKIEYIRLGTEENGDEIMPSAVYIDREYCVETGYDGIFRYIENNIGRKVRLERETVGQVTVHMGEMDRDYFIERDRTFTTKVKASIDANYPGRLFKGLKNYLGMENPPFFKVFNKRFRLKALLTILMNEIKAALHDKIQTADLVVGHPVRFAGSVSKESSAGLKRLETICCNAGFQSVNFLPEPMGAAYSYLHNHNNLKGENVFVFDFGGGTLDLCLLKAESEEFKLTGTHGIPRAGNWIDREMVKEFIFPHLGKGLTYTARGEEIVFPFGEYQESLLNWVNTYTLNHPGMIEMINKGIKYSEKRIQLQRLKKIIRNNLSYSLLMAAEQAKKELSSSTISKIELPELDLKIPVHRDELSKMLAPFLAEIKAEIEYLLHKSNIKVESISHIVCSGGSALIPAVQTMLNSLFPVAPEEWSPFRGIAAGLALYSHKINRD